jgi:lipopolysaccharide export system permease protein
MTLIDRYVARTVLGAILLVMAVLLVLGALFNFIDEQGSVGVGHFDMAEALAYSLLNLPRFALNAFPAGVLIGAMLGIGALARSHELTAVRSAGMSRWRLSATMLGCGLLLLAIALVIGEFVAPRLEQYADERKAIARDGNVSLAGSGGAWVRDGNLVINIAERSSALEFGGIMVFELSPDNRLLSVARADRADSGPQKTWQLGGYAESRFAGDTVSSQRDARRELHTAVSDTFLQMAVVQPSEMALGERLRAMRYLRANRQDYQPYALAFWSGLARSVAIPLGVLFALPFGFGNMRSAGSGARSTLGLAIALVYFFLQRTVESGTVAFSLNPLLLAWVPTLLLATVTGVLLVRTR